jgi:hypothetical protein
MGFEEAKQLIEPFIKLLSASDTRDKVTSIGMNNTFFFFLSFHDDLYLLVNNTTSN